VPQPTKVKEYHMQTSVQTEQHYPAGIRPLTGDEMEAVGGGVVPNPWIVRGAAKLIIWAGTKLWNKIFD
jgi:hypothetical protein